MKKLLVVSVASLVLVLAFSGSAEAKCKLGCLSGKIKGLGRSLAKAEQTVAALSQTVAQQGQTIAAQSTVINEQTQAFKQVRATFSCLADVPVTEFGDPLGEFGYVFRFENEAKAEEEVETSALDVPFQGEEVDAWFVIDRCNTAETASAQAAGALSALADPHSLLQPLARRP